MHCPKCAAPLDASGVFPGGKVHCACGVEVDIPVEHSSAGTLPEGDPYRVRAERTSEAGSLTCPFCGGPCSPDVRACPHCNVQLASVRCPHCYALHFSGARFCARCGKELQLEPLLDATDAPCPRCGEPLSMATGGAADEMRTSSIYECTKCGGLFVDSHTLDELIAREADPAHRVGLLPGHHVPSVTSPHQNDEVVYVKCPMCHTIMNRVNFGKRSGVIVDVCKLHGTWFDSGELTRAIEFVAKGGLEETKKRDAEVNEENKKELARAAAEMQADLARDMVLHGRSVGYLEGRWSSHRGTLLDILWELLR
jgi:Zn-finger nucleic acid-binding protein